jgi:hypothetical protein
MAKSAAQRIEPTPLDPIVSLAVGMAEGPGTYAFLLGAGVSKDAGVPTGGEVLSLALNDLYRLEHPDDEPPDNEGLAVWAAETGRDQLGYSGILELLGPEPEARRSYLEKYFEEKEPAETHRLLARLAAAGLVRVFVTSNFDRLLERALVDEGITPVLVTAADEVRRTTEREHARCYLLKVHGDYLQETIRNTAAELAELEPAIAVELQEIVDRFGLVVLGYSGTDAAAGQCLRARNSRRGVYWVSRSAPAGTAATLIEAMEARVIKRDTAAEFVSDLSRRIGAFRAHPSGETPDVVMAEMINLLRQGDRVGLREKLKQEWRGFETRLRELVEPLASNQAMDEETAQEIDRELTAACERMLAGLFPLIDYDEELFAEQLTWMQRLVGRVKEGEHGWPELPQWGVWWVAQACGAYAMCRRRFDVVGALIRATVDDRSVGDTLATLYPAEAGRIVAAVALVPPGQKDRGPEWRHLIERLNESAFVAEHYPELVEAPGRAARWADDFNFVAAAAITLRDRGGVPGYWTMHGDGAERLTQQLARDSALLGELARACFGLSGEELRSRLKPEMAAAVSHGGRTIFSFGRGWGISDAIGNLPDPPAEPNETS